MVQISRAELLRIHAIIGAHLGEEAITALAKSSNKTAKATKADKAEKKPRANAGQGTAHGAYTAKVLAEHGKDSAEFKEFIAKRIAAAERGEMVYNADQAKVKSGKKAVGDHMDAKDATNAAHIPFVAEWKREHQEEWLAFKSEWDIANPKGSRATSVADDASVAASEAVVEDTAGAIAPVKKTRGRKPMTDEQKAAKKAAKQVAKAAEEVAVAPNAEAAPVVDAVVAEEAVDLSADSEEAEDELLPFSKGGVDYLRWGHLDADGDEIWHEAGYTWLKNADGSRGAFAGKMVGNKLDKSADAMADEPDFE